MRLANGPSSKIKVEGVAGSVEVCFPNRLCLVLSDVCIPTGLCRVSAIQAGGGRVGSASELVSRGQAVKVKVMSVAGTRLSLSIRDVDQVTGEDLSPHLRIKSTAEMLEEQCLHAEQTSTGSNSTPIEYAPPSI